jgi:hypothetical protein
MEVFIIIGTKENVYQDIIGGDFTPHPDKEIIKVFASENKARNFVENAKLAKPKQERYGDLSYYRGGYYSMEIESLIVENN